MTFLELFSALWVWVGSDVAPHWLISVLWGDGKNWRACCDRSGSASKEPVGDPNGQATYGCATEASSLPNTVCIITTTVFSFHIQCHHACKCCAHYKKHIA